MGEFVITGRLTRLLAGVAACAIVVATAVRLHAIRAAAVDDAIILTAGIFLVIFWLAHVSTKSSATSVAAKEREIESPPVPILRRRAPPALVPRASPAGVSAPAAPRTTTAPVTPIAPPAARQNGQASQRLLGVLLGGRARPGRLCRVCGLRLDDSRHAPHP